MSIEHISKVISVVDYAVKVLETYALGNAPEVSTWWNEVFKLRRKLMTLRESS